MTRTVAPDRSVERLPVSNSFEPSAYLSPVKLPSPGPVDALAVYDELSDEQLSAIARPTLAALKSRVSALESCLSAIHSLKQAATFASVFAPGDTYLEAMASEDPPFLTEPPPYTFQQAPLLVNAAAQDASRYAHITAGRAQMATRILGFVDLGLGCVRV